MSNKSLNQLFNELPEKIRDWLTSERATYAVVEINKKLEIFGEALRVIPGLITRLVVKQLEPKDFAGELSEKLGLSNAEAAETAREIFEKILKPIDLQLKEVGVFSGLIFARTTQTPPPPPTTSAPTTPTFQTPPIPSIQRPVPPLIQTQEAAHPPQSQNPPSIVKIPINVTTPRPPLPPVPPKPPIPPTIK